MLVDARVAVRALISDEALSVVVPDPAAGELLLAGPGVPLCCAACVRHGSLPLPPFFFAIWPVYASRRVASRVFA